MAKSIFITGANGFIGRHLLARLEPRQFDHIYCLTRSDINPREIARGENFHWLAGSIFDSRIYSGCLDSVDAVIHLAATTGKAQREQYFTVNSKGTECLVKQCKEHGVNNFLYVSSIVVKYKDISHYYYAQSKQEGEVAVIQSGLDYAIVRPTIVLGKDSPSWKALSNFARLRLIPVLGTGTTQIQPIDVDDTVDAIISIIQEGAFRNESFDLGGPEILSIEDFLKRIHWLYTWEQPRVIHLPYKPLRWFVAFTEKYLSRLVPLNAGQLSVFVEDGTTAANQFFEKRRLHMKDVNTMLKALISNERHCN
jgi:nucleoside-diphosphate-sugar epimerase